MDVILLTSRSQFLETIYDFSDYFECVSDDSGRAIGISLKKSRSIDDLEYRFVWKSETEFDEAVKKELSARILRELRCELKALTSPRGEEETDGKSLFLINEQIYQAALLGAKNVLANPALEKNRIGLEKSKLKVYQVLRKFSYDNALEYHFAVICSGHFESNYKKLAVNEIYV